jgi:hypothetical protein
MAVSWGAAAVLLLAAVVAAAPPHEADEDAVERLALDLQRWSRKDRGARPGAVPPSLHSVIPAEGLHESRINEPLRAATLHVLNGQPMKRAPKEGRVSLSSRVALRAGPG